MTITLLLYSLKLNFILFPLRFTQLTDFIHTNFTVSYRDAVNRLLY